ncbi:winged helix-turn-helix transcriptional regulator [Streptomyces stelliscabiei]|nr:MULTISPECIES: winged helix-turn-helix transcriptional regulator [Streptomyces]MDX2521837.1 winged helix-turn-helix transcriptional regulator [Streptomyces stelliscabiei]
MFLLFLRCGRAGRLQADPRESLTGGARGQPHDHDGVESGQLRGLQRRVSGLAHQNRAVPVFGASGVGGRVGQQRPVGQVDQRGGAAEHRHGVHGAGHGNVGYSDLEAGGLITRTVHPSHPPTVQYALTDLARGVTAALQHLQDWAEQHTGDYAHHRHTHPPTRSPERAGSVCTRCRASAYEGAP